MEKKFSQFFLRLIRNYLVENRLRNRISKVGNLNQKDMNKAMRGKGTSLMLTRILVGLATLMPEDEFRKAAYDYVECIQKVAHRIKQKDSKNKKNE